MSALPESHPAPERDAYSFGQMTETGLLWLVNRVVFHPRGFALALDYGDGEDEPRGWSIVAAGCFGGRGRPVLVRLAGPDGARPQGCHRAAAR